jgi:glycogen debranching enzyme
MTAFEERPHSPYYGSADASPLYVVLLDEYERWTGDRRLVRELESEARAALRWIDEYADLMGTGYVWYQRRNDLKRRFNRDFWVKDREFFALALDTEGNQVDAAGVQQRPSALERHRRQVEGESGRPTPHGPRLFSGWGVRTLAEGEGRYNPIGYHVGTVWPFDNSFIAWGLRRYGFKEEAAQSAAGSLEAADFFDGRLPEAFGGYERGVTKYPVQYPTACSPQAWSTGTPLLLLRTMLGLEPIDDNLIVDPSLPESVGLMALLDIPGRWGRVDAFARGRGLLQAQRRPLRQG